MLTRLQALIGDIAVRPTKLILLIGGPGTGKTALLGELGKSCGTKVLNLSLALSLRLTTLAQQQRVLQASKILRALDDEHANGDLLLLDNIELLFDRTLHLDVLRLLKQLAHARRVVVAWPGQRREGRLTYAERGHPEFQDFGPDGWMPFDMESKQ